MTENDVKLAIVLICVVGYLLLDCLWLFWPRKPKPESEAWRDGDPGPHYGKNYLTKGNDNA